MLQAKGVNDHFGYIGRKETRQGRPDLDIFEPKGKQGQEYCHSLLLVPAEIKGQRKLIYIVQTKGFLELQGDYGQGVRVVALTGIQDAGDATDIAQIQFDIAILGTTRQ